MADYPEFDIFASTIIEKYGYDKEKFIRDSLHKDMVRELINNCIKRNQLESLYKDLCYLGIIKERIYLLKGFQKINDELDPANNPDAVYKTVMKVLK